MEAHSRMLRPVDPQVQFHDLMRRTCHNRPVLLIGHHVYLDSFDVRKTALLGPSLKDGAV